MSFYDIRQEIAAGATVRQLLTEYLYLETHGIVQALRRAVWRPEEREIILASS